MLDKIKQLISGDQAGSEHDQHAGAPDPRRAELTPEQAHAAYVDRIKAAVRAA